MSLIDVVKQGLTIRHAPKVVDELLEAYIEVKQNFFEGGLRLSAVEGGRFCEAAFRILQERTTGHFTPLGRQVDADKTINDLRKMHPGAEVDSVRLHIPRALRVVYDIRNNRDAAHLADGIDPNKQDATLVVSTVDWVLAEFVRLYHSVGPDEAHRIVDALVTRRVPIVQNFNGFLKVLNPALGAGEHILVLLYQMAESGASYEQLHAWVRPVMRSNLRKTLSRLEHDKAFIHFDGEFYYITEAGIREVELRHLITVSD